MLEIKPDQASQYVSATTSSASSRNNAGAESVGTPKAEAQVPVEFISSPKGKIDSSSGMFVIQFRDKSSGEVTQEYPSKKASGNYQKAEQLTTTSSSSQGASRSDSVAPESQPATSASVTTHAMDKASEA